MATVIPPDITAPRAAATPTEARLARLWERVLNVPAVAPDDDFFALGGSSLAAAEIFAAIHRDWGRRLPLATLYRRPTLRALAAALDASPAAAPLPAATHSPSAQPGPGPEPGPVVALSAGTRGVPLVIVPGVGGDVVGLGHLVRALPAEQAVWGLRSPGLEPGEEPAAGIPELATHFAAALVALRPAGPFALLGLCLGGIVALELARQLTARGVAIDFLGLLDPPSPGAAPPVAAPSFVARRLALYRSTLATLPVAQWPGYLGRRLGNAARAVGRGQALAGDPAEAGRAAVAAANRAALRRYQLPPAPVPVSLFFMADRPGDGVAAARAAWIDRFDCAGRVEIVPGSDTGDALQPRHAPALAAAIGRARAAGAPVACTPAAAYNGATPAADPRAGT